MANNENRFDTLSPDALNHEEQESVIQLALAVLAEKHSPGRPLISSEDTRSFLRLKLGERRSEVFGVLFLDTRHRLIKMEEMFQGTIDGAAVHPRVVAQRALELNAAAIIVFHNHPSGVAEPSLSDKSITQLLKDALALVDVRMLDHYIVAAGEGVSFAEQGLM